MARIALVIAYLAVLHLGGSPTHAQVRASPPVSTGDTPSVVGSWSGTLALGPSELEVFFHVDADSAGPYSATMDVPAQGARGIPVSSVEVSPDSLHLVIQPINGRYDGARIADSIKGTWTQNGQSFPLTLTPVPDSVNTTPSRPQTPEPPFPYSTEELTFENTDAGIALAGTLTRPAGDGPHPAVVLISGSGPQSRDSEVMGHKLFLVVADHLTRQGIAVFRYDERGVGASDGTFATATSADLARDAQAAVEMLAVRDDVRSVGIYGHSEGGWVAPMVDARSDAVDFLVLMAPPGVPGDDLINEQRARITEAQGASAAFVDSVRAQQDRVTTGVASAPDSAAAARHIQTSLEASGLPQNQIDAQIRAMTTPWFRYFVSNDPAEALRQVDVPVLALFAENDLQVIPEQNRPPLEAALETSDSPDVTVDTVPGMNHLFQPSETGRISEYAQIETTIAPAVLERVTTWIQAHAP